MAYDITACLWEVPSLQLIPMLQSSAKFVFKIGAPRMTTVAESHEQVIGITMNNGARIQQKNCCQGKKKKNFSVQTAILRNRSLQVVQSWRS